MVRIKRLRYTLEPLRMEESLKDPYRVKILRKVNIKMFNNRFSFSIIQMLNILFFLFDRYWMDALFAFMDIG